MICVSCLYPSSKEGSRGDICLFYQARQPGNPIRTLHGFKACGHAYRNMGQFIYDVDKLIDASMDREHSPAVQGGDCPTIGMGGC